MRLAAIGRFPSGAGAVANAVLVSPEIPADPDSREPRRDRVRIAIDRRVDAAQRIAEEVALAGPA